MTGSRERWGENYKKATKKTRRAPVFADEVAQLALVHGSDFGRLETNWTRERLDQRIALIQGLHGKVSSRGNEKQRLHLRLPEITVCFGWQFELLDKTVKTFSG